MITKADLVGLAQQRLHDANALLATGYYAGAAYIAGYAVECALKAHIAKMTVAEQFYDKDIAERLFTHDFEALLKKANLKNALDIQSNASPQFQQNWIEVKSWRPEWRYDLRKAEPEARRLIGAIEDPKDGVLTWLLGKL